jgi:alpha-glucosidase
LPVKKEIPGILGALTNWDSRDLTLDLSFLDNGEYKAVIFKDGINANREANDYKKEVINVKAGNKLNIKLMNGGGWAARIERVK